MKPTTRLGEGWEAAGGRTGAPGAHTSTQAHHFATDAAEQQVPVIPQRHMFGNPDWSAIFAPHGYVFRQGDLIRRMNLARTLHTITEEGAEAFYKVLRYDIRPETSTNFGEGPNPEYFAQENTRDWESSPRTILPSIHQKSLPHFKAHTRTGECILRKLLPPAPFYSTCSTSSSASMITTTWVRV
ncbi:hypothetical protein K439DRAFT_929169 [Ramaria rubella]|nr:hypothetical protein K439DRAFT_929169 [Ramaria rubella]